MMPSRIIQIVRLAIPLIAFHRMAYTSAAAAQSDAARAASPPPTIAELLAGAGYVGIPFSWDDGRDAYQFVYGKIDTVSVDFALDSGMNFDFALDPSLEQLPGVRPMAAASTTASLYGTQTIRNAALDQVSLGPVALGPLAGRLVPPIISSAKGMLGVTVFADRAAIFDFATDTLYLLAADTTPWSLKQPPANPRRNLRTTLEAAGQYRTFLSLMEAAGLMPLLDQRARGDVAVDSLAWDGLGGHAVHHAGLDTMPDGGERLRLTRKAMDQQFRPAGQVTVFAPTDAAFAHLAPNTLQALRADRTQLAAVLRAHLLTSTSLQTSTLRTLIRGASQPAGPTLGFHPLGSQLDVDRVANWKNGTVLARATIVQPDLVAVNGVAHGIDRVLISPASPSPLAAALERQGYVAIPLDRLPGGLYVVRAEVNGTTLILAVDTGAPPELDLATPVAERLDASGRGSVSVTLHGGPVLPINFGSIDLSAVNAKLKLLGSPPIDGLLGTQTLTKYHARYDFGTGTLYLRLPATTTTGEPTPSPP